MTIPRLCVIGAGALSTRRIYPYIGAAGASLAGSCDLDLKKASSNCARWGGQPASDWQQMIAEQKPDGVIICIDGKRHGELAAHLLEQGIPTYTEKPPAENAAQAAKTLAIAERSGTPYMCAFKKRYATAYSRAAEWLASFPNEDHLAYGATYASGNYANENQRCDFLFDFCIHHIDLACHLMGPVATVHAIEKQRRAWMINLRFISGALGSLHFNCGRSFCIPTETVELTVNGGNAMSITNSSSWRIINNEQCSEWREPPTFTSAGDSGHDTGLLTELEAFVQVILGNTSANRSDATACLHTMQVYEAIVNSAKTEQQVSLSTAHTFT